MSSVEFRYSKDGGANWSDWTKLDLGTTGQFTKRVTRRRLGVGIQWVFAYRITDNVRADCLAASAQLELCDGR
jgi:regulation of enolase protein 1 (concanavalin A-like superfamily)